MNIDTDSTDFAPTHGSREHANEPSVRLPVVCSFVRSFVVPATIFVAFQGLTNTKYLFSLSFFLNDDPRISFNKPKTARVKSTRRSFSNFERVQSETHDIPISLNR